MEEFLKGFKDTVNHVMGSMPDINMVDLGELCAGLFLLTVSSVFLFSIIYLIIVITNKIAK